MVAIRTIVVADLVMSLDNVIAIAAAAKGDKVLVILGLVISIPFIVVSSTFLLKLMDRFPRIITIGAALLGWVAGDMVITDPSLTHWVESNIPWIRVQVPVIGSFSWMQILGAAFVVIVGHRLAKQKAIAANEKIDLVHPKAKKKKDNYQ